MEILIINQSLVRFAGTELFTLEIASALTALGHNVTVYAPVIGKVVNNFAGCKFKITDDIQCLKSKEFDVIHAHHNVVSTFVRSIFPDIPMVFMSHGIVPLLEQPPYIDLNIAQFIAVSEEVRDNLVSNYDIDYNKIKIVRNFVDTDKFYIKNAPNKKLKNILVISNHFPLKNKRIVNTAAHSIGAKVKYVGLPKLQVRNIHEYINRADLVITLGRGVLEACSCGRNVIVYDQYGADGFVDLSTFGKFRQNNFSGRYLRIDYNVELLIQEMKKYNPSLGYELRQKVCNEHSVYIIANQLLNIYNSTIQKHTRKRVFDFKINEIEWALNIYNKCETYKIKLHYDLFNYLYTIIIRLLKRQF